MQRAQKLDAELCEIEFRALAFQNHRDTSTEFHIMKFNFHILTLGLLILSSGSVKVCKHLGEPTLLVKSKQWVTAD